MSGITETQKRSKKTCRLGHVQVLRVEPYDVFDVETKVECIRALIPLGLLHVQVLLEEEVYMLAGARYARKSPPLPGWRQGSNPSTVQLAGQPHPLRIPRVPQHRTGGEILLQTLEHFGNTVTLDEVLLKGVLYGISCRNYEAAAKAVPGGIGLSSSTVFRAFTHARTKQLKALQERDPRELDLVPVLLDWEDLPGHDEGGRSRHYDHGGQTRPRLY